MAPEETAKIKLYWLNNSRAHRIVWLLESLKLPYEIELFQRDKKTQFAPPSLEKIHPLGKAPVLSITPPGGGEPIVLAESGFIVQYLCEHFAGGSDLVPKKWQDGKEGQVAGETESWLRFQYLLHYCEGSLMLYLLLTLILNQLRSSAVPFFIRPISSAIASRISSGFVFPNIKRHLAFLESLLRTAPGGGGKYLCGPHLTAADMLMSFPLVAARDRFETMGKWDGGSPQAAFPLLFEYIDRLQAEEGLKRADEKIKEIESQKKSDGKGKETGEGVKASDDK